MKAELRLPETYTEYIGNALISNLNGVIDKDIEEAIVGKALFSRYAAWNFNALIWWDDKIGFWCGEVWQFRKYQATFLAETLEALAAEIDQLFGDGETPSYFF